MKNFLKSRPWHLWIFLSMTFLLSCNRCQPREQKADDHGLMEWRGKVYKHGDLPVKVQQSLHAIHKRYRNRMKVALDNYIVEEFVEHRAKELNKSPEEVKEELLAITEPTDQEVREFYEKNKKKIPYTYKQSKQELKEVIKSQQIYNKQADLLAMAEKWGEYRFLIPELEPPTADIDISAQPFKGNEQADIIVVEFADYTCPHCREAFEHLKSVFPKLQDKIKFVFMDFPLKKGRAVMLARGAYCAKKQGKFWDFHDLLYEEQKNGIEPLQAAERVGLDSMSFAKCLNSETSKKFVQKSKQQGLIAGVKATPAFFVNGKMTDAGFELNGLIRAIEDISSR